MTYTVSSGALNSTQTKPNPGLTRVSQYEKGRIDLDFTEEGNNEWQWHQLDHMLGQLSLASIQGRLIEYQLRLG